MEPGIILWVRQLGVQHRGGSHSYLHASAKEDADPRTGQHQHHRGWRHKGSGYEKERGPVVVWECVFCCTVLPYLRSGMAKDNGNGASCSLSKEKLGRWPGTHC